jgi:mycothiol system anti-sigma-R factor
MSQPSNPFIPANGTKPSCMEMLQLILDGEASPEQKEYFSSHMDRCMPCFKSYHVDNKIKELIKSKCCGGQVPTDLVEQIKSKISRQMTS